MGQIAEACDVVDEDGINGVEPADIFPEGDLRWRRIASEGEAPRVVCVEVL